MNKRLTPLLHKFSPQSASTHGKKTSPLSEMVAFAIVWLVLILMYLFAGYANSSGATRYQLEAHSHTSGISQPSFITDVCGDKFLVGFYKKKNQDLYLNTSKCQGVTEQNYRHALDKASTQLLQVNQSLAGEWKKLSAIKKKQQLIANETELVTINDSLINRKKWLNLDDDGTLDSLPRLLEYQTNYLANQPKSSIVNTAEVKPSANNLTQTESSSNQSQTPQHDWSNIDLGVSMLAIAQGDERFPYSVLFKGDPDLAKLMNEVASDVNLVYQTNRNQGRAKTASRLLPSFGHLFHLSLLPQVFIWSLMAFILLGVSRSLYHPVLLLPIGCIAWGLVLMFVSHGYIASMNSGMILFCVGVFLLVFSMFGWGKKIFTKVEDNRNQLSSPWLYPLFVFFTTFGLWILVDLSSRGYLKQRYFFHTHFTTLFFCYVLISLSFLNNHLFAKAIQWFGLNNVLSALWSNNNKQKHMAIAQLVLAGIGFLGLMILLRSDSAKVAEIAKIWFVIFMGMFLAVNQRNLIDNIIRSTNTKIFLLIAVLPVLAGLVLAERGTLFTILFVLMFFLGVAVSNKVFNEGARGNLIGIFVSMACVMVLMVVIMNIGGIDDRTSERVLTWINPFVSTNDQMAIIHWFRDSAPPFGYGFGDVPWCGFTLSRCRGVPLQMQSDYTITSISAVIGIYMTMAFIALFFFWLYKGAKKQMAFANHHTQSQHISSSHMIISWVVLLWVIVTFFQAAVTISGNFGILPLTGITLPFLSYGKSSLLFNTFMFGLLLYIPSAKTTPTMITQTQGVR